ncbi:MAG: hypothetical protein M3R63_17640 [Actinomycetota bacterium]|nr:hypothetical protein [Actinomycetota bacterium]
MAIDQRGNVLLGKLLAELAWSPSRLTEAVNGLLGPGYVGRSTVSEWLHQDRVPRHPLPTVVVHLISDALDREVSVDELWSGRARRAELWVPADDGLHLPWTAAGTVDVLDDWLRHTGGSIGMDRRIFLAVSGAALTAPAWGYVDHLAGTRGGSFAALADAGRTLTVTPAMVDAVAATTAGIRKLGDSEGGHADNLRFVHHHLTWVGKLLRQSRFTTGVVADRLLAEWAQLAQLAGWMAHDAGKHGLAQRYFTSGLHAAHTAGDRSVGTYLLTCMSQTRVIQGRLDDGIDLTRAARDAVELDNAAYDAAKATPAAVRALAVSGSARAQAALGNARGFHSAADEARALLDTPGALEARPPYLAWFGPATLEGQLAQGGLTLAGVTSRDCRVLLDGADAVLGRTATDAASTPRKAVFHAAQLSRAHVAAGDLDRAVPAGQAALRRLPTVHSRCCALVLRRLEADLAALPPARRPAAVRSLHDQLRATHAT